MLAYQHFSESRQKFASLKAFFILDLIEVGIWGAAGGMTIAATLRRCEGVSCSLSWTVAVLALILWYVILLEHLCSR